MAVEHKDTRRKHHDKKRGAEVARETDGRSRTQRYSGGDLNRAQMS